MSERSSERLHPGFFRRLTIAAARLLIPIHSGLILIYFVLHALSGSNLWFIDALGFILPWLFIPSVVLLPLALWNRLRKLSIIASLPPILFLLTYGHLYLPRLPISTTDSTITVMTHNVYYENKSTDQIMAVIEAHKPDVLGLNELDISVAQELANRISEKYPYYYIKTGQGIFSRYPIENCTTFEMSRWEWAIRLAQQCVLSIDGRQVTLIHAHPYTIPIQMRKVTIFGIPLGIPLGLNNQYRDAELDGLLSQMTAVDGSLIVIGDFNLTDQQNHYAKLTRDLRDAHRESGWGMGFSFTRYPRIGVPMWRIDYILYSPDMVALNTTVGDYGGSDHRPVITKLSFIETSE